MKAIIIDPIPFQRRVLALLLAEEGFEEIAQVSTSDEAGASVAGATVLFADLSVDPNAVAHAGIPWIVTGPEAEDHALAARIEEGASAFLSKPFTLPNLRQSLADMRFLESAVRPS